MPTLHLSRIRNIATETFKCLHQLHPSYLHDLVHYRNSSYSFRYTGLLDVPPVRTTSCGKRSLRFEATQVWNNNLSEVIINFMCFLPNILVSYLCMSYLLHVCTAVLFILCMTLLSACFYVYI